MGSFSWIKADTLTNVANIVDDEPFKFLIPKEFGGGFIKDYYQDYGCLGTKSDGTPKYDMYELLAVWNKEACSKIKGIAPYDIDKETYGIVLEENTNMPEISIHTEHNRHLGIKIGCYDDDIDKLKYPLKLVSASYNGTYEECDGRSYGDPNQGWNPLSWEQWKQIKNFKKTKSYRKNK